MRTCTDPHSLIALLERIVSVGTGALAAIARSITSDATSPLYAMRPCTSSSTGGGGGLLHRDGRSSSGVRSRGGRAALPSVFSSSSLSAFTFVPATLTTMSATLSSLLSSSSSAFCAPSSSSSSVAPSSPLPPVDPAAPTLSPPLPGPGEASAVADEPAPSDD